MNDRNASPRITPGSSRKTAITSTPRVFGSRCRSRMTRAARADRVRGTHVVVLLQRDDLPADDTGRREPRGDGQRDHHRPEARAAEDCEHDDRERQVREPVERVEETHQDVVHHPAEKTGEGAIGDADRKDHEGGGEADPDRHTAAERRPREQVAAELVGAERMLEARALAPLREVDLVGVVRARSAAKRDSTRGAAGRRRPRSPRRGFGCSGTRRRARGSRAFTGAPASPGAPSGASGYRCSFGAAGTRTAGPGVRGRLHQRASRVRGSRIP